MRSHSVNERESLEGNSSSGHSNCVEAPCALNGQGGESDLGGHPALPLTNASIPDPKCSLKRLGIFSGFGNIAYI